MHSYWPFSWGANRAQIAPAKWWELDLAVLLNHSETRNSPAVPGQAFLSRGRLLTQGKQAQKDANLRNRSTRSSTQLLFLNSEWLLCHCLNLQCPFSYLPSTHSQLPLTSNSSFLSNTHPSYYLFLEVSSEILKQFSSIDFPLWIPKYLFGFSQQVDWKIFGGRSNGLSIFAFPKLIPMVGAQLMNTIDVYL